MCTTSYSNKNGCPGVHMDIDSSGGDNGAEVITCENPTNFSYLMFVHAHGVVSSLASSGVRLALYSITKQMAAFNVPTIDPTGASR